MPDHMPIDRDLLNATRAVLHEGESLDHFIDQVLCAEVTRRRRRNELLERAIVSSDRAHRAGRFISAEQVIDKLQGILRASEAAPRQKP